VLGQDGWLDAPAARAPACSCSPAVRRTAFAVHRARLGRADSAVIDPALQKKIRFENEKYLRAHPELAQVGYSTMGRFLALALYGSLSVPTACCDCSHTRGVRVSGANPPLVCLALRSFKKTYQRRVCP